MLNGCLGAPPPRDLGEIQLASVAVKSRQFKFTPQAQQYAASAVSAAVLASLPEQLRPREFDADEILPGKLWLGSVESAQHSARLRKHGIKFIFTCADRCVLLAGERGLANWKSGVVDHALLDVQDLPSVDLSRHFDSVINWLERAMLRGPVLVHCVQGVSRSATFVVAYLIAKQHYSLDQALELVKRKRPVANPNYGFLAQLSRYEHTLSSLENNE
ncbi:hypothetical protein BASA81_012696 [Batrachochytrium salamandrivorans]|nr:hypothetical protein BASA81_012696 [Batrachochytrium salamandrivorans]